MLRSNLQGKRQVGVRVMTQSLDYWRKETGLTKFDLAKKSNVWKVYINPNGFKRTQTLDKYLDQEQFPKNPRWPHVYQTANFVLSFCKASTKLRLELKKSFAKLKEFK